MPTRSIRSVLCALTLLAAVGCSDDDSGAPNAAPVVSLSADGHRAELGPTELKVMTFNVWLGGNVVDIAQVAAAIQASDADVVGLQESDGNARRIAELVGWAHVDEQQQVISRYPLIAPADSDGYVYVQLAPGQVVAIANIHLPSDPYGPSLVRDGSTVDDVLANEQDLRVSDLQSKAEGWTSAFDQGIPLVLTGDFNTPSFRDWTDEMVGKRAHLKYAVDWPVSHAVEDLGFVDTYRSVHPDPVEHPGITWTFGYPYPRLLENEVQDRIDFVYTAGATSIEDSQIVGPAGVGDVGIPVNPYPSDHLGVVSTIVVDPVEPPLFVSPDEIRVEVGDPIGVYYHAPGGYETDRIVLMPAGGDPETDGFTKLDTAEAGFFGRIALGTAGQPPGEYEAVLLTVDDAGSPKEVSRNNFWLVERGAQPTVSADANVPAGSPIDVKWTNAPGRKFDWIGIFAADDPDMYAYSAFAYTDRTVDGSYEFTTDDLGEEMLPPGDYIVRLMSDDSYVSLAEATFTVTG
jgi:endonuclease/exonuclease/phosphatase family metal-dependent hydrolase